MSNSEASSRTVVCELASTKALNISLSTSDGRPLCSSSSPPRNFLNHYCAVRSVVVHWSNASLILRVVSEAFRSSLN